MNDTEPSLKQLNRTLIGSVLFIDIVGYSTRTVPDQLEMKDLFNRLLADAVRNVAPADRIMVDTGDGAGVAFLGDPEDALFAALSLRDAIAAAKVGVGEPGFLRMGINVGPLKVVRDINGHTNMIGDGVNDAQRVMSFSEPGQVMVSHSFYDIISRLSRDYAQLFVYEGTRHDKHVRAHAVYRFGPTGENESLTEKLRERARARCADTLVAQGRAARPAMPKLPATVATRTGMVALLIGAGSIVGAVWSGTSTPEQPAAAAPVLAALPAVHEPKPAAAIAAAKPLELNVANGAQAPAKAAENPATAPNKTAEKPVRTAESPAPASKPGTVKLAIRPWGEVYVNGSKRGVSPPLNSLSLPPGKYRIEIRNGEFAPHKETIEVASGKQATVRTVF